MTEVVNLKTFYPNAADITIPRPTNLFLPDDWTRIFAAGLNKLAHDKRLSGTVLEVGVGAGPNLCGLLLSPNKPQQFIGTDICHDAIAASREIAQRHNLSAQLVQSDLLSSFSKLDLCPVDHIVACIPQVPLPKDKNLSDEDNAAHYYVADGRSWDRVGLGLNARLLEEATTKASHAAITLNLAGRPGIDNLHALFKAYGREASITHSDIVPQHAETSLASLAEQENYTKQNFEFFADRDGQIKINATQAEVRRTAGQPVFHRVYVLTSASLA